MSILTFLGYIEEFTVIIFGVFFLLVLPMRGYSRGMRTGFFGWSIAGNLVIGGGLFFIIMQIFSYLERNTFHVAGLSADFSGVMPGILSLLGIGILFVGVLVIFVYWIIDKIHT